MRHQILLFVTSIAFLAGTSGPGAALPQSGTGEHPKTSVKTGPANDSSVLLPVTIMPSQVQVVQDAGQTMIQVSSKHPLHYHTVRMDNSRCLVVDIENAKFPTAPKSYSGDSTLISEVRVAQRSDDAGSVVRVVAQLVGNPKFEIESVATGLRILLNSRNTITAAGAKEGTKSPETPAKAVAKGVGSGPSTVQRKPGAMLSGPASSSYQNVGSAAAPPSSPDPPASSKQHYLHGTPGLLRSQTLAQEANLPKANSASKAVPPAAQTSAQTSKSEAVRAVSRSAPVRSSFALSSSATQGDSTSAKARRPVSVGQTPGTSHPSTENAGQSKDKTARKAPAPALTTANLRPRPSQSRDRFAGLRADASAVPAGTPEVRKAEEAAKTLASKISPDAGGVLPVGTASAPHAWEPAPSDYSGEKISVNLKDVDLKDFFRLIHEVSGLNIVVDPDVAGSVTLVLDDVPWDQALEIVLKNNGLGKTLEGNVLRIAKVSTLTAEQEGTAKLAEARSQATPLVTVFRSLKYAHAEDRQLGSNSGISQQGPQTVPIPGIATLLQKLPGVLSKRGSVMADVRDNAVIVTDAASQIPIIDGVIAKLDNKTKQISIQARIVQASSNFTKTLSSALSGALTNPSGSTKGGGASGSPGVNAGSPTPSGSGSSSVWIPNNIRGIAGTASAITPGIASGFGVLAITNASKNYFINAAIGAAEQRQQAKTISAPSLVTQDNMPGEVIQGAQIPIQTTINNTISVQYINASLQLDVTPQVTGDGSVFLTIKVVNATPGAVIGTSGNPQINTQQVTTQVLVPDGGTVVFGGVKVTSRKRSNNQVPGIGNVPILGDLFKAKDDEDQDQELLFFVTPQVVS